MLTFKKPELEDLAWIAPLVRQSGLMGCDYAPATLLIWQEKYHTSIGKGSFWIPGRGITGSEACFGGNARGGRTGRVPAPHFWGYA